MFPLTPTARDRARKNPVAPRSRRPARPAAAVAAAEPLEQRAMFAVTPDPGSTFDAAYPVGPLQGSVTYNEAVGPADAFDVYKFTMPRAGTFHGRVRAYNAPAVVSLHREVIGADGRSAAVLVDSRTATQGGPDNGFGSGDLPGRTLQAGNYFLHVHGSAGPTDYLVRMTADYAGPSLAAARDVGVASEDTYRDFVGAAPGGSPGLEDTADLYKVRMDDKGPLTVNLRLDNTNTSLFKAHVDLIRDANNNGAVDAGEIISSTPSGTGGTLIHGTTGPGTYFLRVVPDLGASNYSLRVNAEYAGNAEDAWRDVGSLDTGRHFADYIHGTHDWIDQYRFRVTSPRVLYASFAGDDGASAGLILYRDSNLNGVAEAMEVVTSAPKGQTATLFANASNETYILRVNAEAGTGGKYRLFAETRPDGAGNTLATAKNLGTVNGLRSGINDYVTVPDLVDFYKFTTSAAGTVTAALTPQPGGGDANLALIRDANNNGKVDASEVLASSALPANQQDRVSKSVPAGTYFLRVAHPNTGGPSKYYLSVATDYAGQTPATARNAGGLAGVTRTYNDWASQSYGGGLSDTTDVYKFTLGSTRTFKAALTGELSGQDLNLALFRDANNDGVLSASEQLASSTKPNTANEQLSRSLGAGTYYVRVLGANGDTNYKLTMGA